MVSGDSCQQPWLRLIAEMMPSGTNHPYTTTCVLAVAFPAALLLYLTFLRRSSKGPTPEFIRLITKQAGTGKAAKKWSSADADTVQNGGVVTWLGGKELKVLEALCDTLLPGFEIDTAKGANAVVDQVVAVVESVQFRGKRKRKSVSACSAQPDARGLPAPVEAYTRGLARRCLEMHGRSASDIGVAGLLASAFEANISLEQRSGLGVLFWVLNTRLGALLLTGRAVPIVAQSFAARHALLRRWSVSRIAKFREAFQGVKRLSCSLYFSAHPEVSIDANNRGSSTSLASVAAMKTNPNWVDIRYEPQHHRIARDGAPSVPPAAKPGLWSGAKVKAAQAARAAAAAVASSPTRRSSNPPSPCSLSSSSSAAPPSFFSRGRSDGSGNVGTNSSRDNIGSSPTPAAAAAETPVPSLLSEIVVDVVVVGSGAGGGCVAGTLAARGLKVAVLEKGGAYDAADFAGFSEMEAYRAMYECQGVLATDDGAVVLLAGSCVGGGTTVNWTASFRTPTHVRMEWARKLGLKSFEPGGPFDKALDTVCDRLGVNTEYSHRAPGCPVPNASLRVNQHQTSLWNGAAASGLCPKVIPRNAKGCVDCGSCMHGCASGSKRSTHATWLQDGIESGNLLLIPNAKVDRVLKDAGRATGVVATVTPRGGDKATTLTVTARAVVVSGGAINTPAILLRSGLKHPLIGRHLCLHPVVLAGGVFPEDYGKGNGDATQGKSCAATATATTSATTSAGGGGGGAVMSAVSGKLMRARSIDAHAKPEIGAAAPVLAGRVPEFGRGVMMGVYVQDWMGIHGGYGFVVEAPPIHPGLAGLVLPWNDALSHRLLVSMMRESSVFLCIGRDRSSEDNRVVLGPRGDPVIKYKLGREDGQVLLRGRSEMLRLMRRAGAAMVIPAHEGAPWFCPEVGGDADERFEEYVEAVEELGTTPNEAGVYSAHQMGSCRLSATPEGGPLRETGETWECDSLFVADASVFPTALGINPMITVEAVAYMIAEQVATRLGKEALAEGQDGRSVESSPLRRRLTSFGKAMAAKMTRDTSSGTDRDTSFFNFDVGESGAGGGFGGFGGFGISGGGGDNWGSGRAHSPTKGSGRISVAVMDDYGVDCDKLSW